MGQVGRAILLACGILIAGLSGLCSLSILFGSGEFSGRGMWPTVAVIGGVPFALGAVMIFFAWRAIRRARLEPQANLEDTTDVLK